MLKIKRRFNNDIKKLDMIGFIYFCLDPDISIRKSKSLSLDRSLCMNRQKVSEYFKLLGIANCLVISWSSFP